MFEKNGVWCFFYLYPRRMLPVRNQRTNVYAECTFYPNLGHQPTARHFSLLRHRSMLLLRFVPVFAARVVENGWQQLERRVCAFKPRPPYKFKIFLQTYSLAPSSLHHQFLRVHCLYFFSSNRMTPPLP